MRNRGTVRLLYASGITLEKVDLFLRRARQVSSRDFGYLGYLIIPALELLKRSSYDLSCVAS
eukprot:COSAG02_NODE_4932_length_4819_cov_3.269915_2_plen_62_part_00